MAVAEGRFLKAFAWSVHLGYRKVCARLIPPILTLKITGCGWLIQSSAPDLWHLWSNASGWECYCMATSPGNTWVREKSRKQCMVPKGGNPLQTARKKPAREEDILDFFFQDKGCCPATSPPPKKKKNNNKKTPVHGNITGIYYTDLVLSLSGDLVHQKARPNTGMRGMKLQHKNTPAQTSKLVQDYLLARGTLKLYHSLLTRLPLLRVTYFLSPSKRNTLLVVSYTRVVLRAVLF